MAKITDLTKGNITRVILAFFFPMLMTNLLQQIYTVADTAIVGQGLGDDKLAAVGNMASLTFLVSGLLWTILEQDILHSICLWICHLIL